MTYIAPTGENSQKMRPVAEVGVTGDLGKNTKPGLALRALSHVGRLCCGYGLQAKNLFLGRKE